MNIKNKTLIGLIVFMSFIIGVITINTVNSANENSHVFYGDIKNGEVELRSLIKLSGVEETEENLSSVYTAEFLYLYGSGSESILKTYKYDVYDGLVFETEEIYKFFYFIADIPQDTKKIVFKENGNILKELFLTVNPPVVENININDLGNLEFNITWQASDLDNEINELKYILWSGDETNGWNLLGSNVEGSSYLLNTSAETFPGGNHKIKIIASDGFNTGELISAESFSVPRKNPNVMITSINESSEFFRFKPLILEGFAYDPEDGDIDVSWKVDGLGIGEGFVYIENPEYGTHLIELSATDSDTNQVTEYKEIFVNWNPDITGEGFVGGADLSIVLANWGMSNAKYSEGDVSEDGFVGGADYSAVLGYWGREI